MAETVSIIITVLNGEYWIDKCLTAITKQTIIDNVQLEICVFDDSSTDKSVEVFESWKERLLDNRISLKIIRNLSGKPLGVGSGRNRAFTKSSGNYICFQDIDDEMYEERIELQLKMAKENKNAIIGSQFQRTPKKSTERFTNWANYLPDDKLEVQIYTSNGPTIIMPTWFCHRDVINKVGGFSEKGKGTPEDLLFFYRHLDFSGKILRVNKILVNYNYHFGATTFSIEENTIWSIRLNRLIKCVLPLWYNGFTIWNAGKQGRKFYRSLPEEFKRYVMAFCDVDKNKINKFYKYFDPITKKEDRPIPIIHFTEAKSPLLICVKIDMTNGEFEKNLKSLKLKEGLDYVIFS